MKTPEAKIYKKDFSHPDERREFKANGHLDLMKFEDGTVVGLGFFEPGWRWSNDVKPLAGTDSCEADHTGYCLKGRMRTRMNNGEEFEFKAGDVIRIPAGHDAWVVGDETCELLDVTGYKDYARKSQEEAGKKVA